MRAKRKGTDSYSRVVKIQLENSDILYDPSVIEFESDATSTERNFQTENDKYWQGVKVNASIAAMQGLLSKYGPGIKISITAVEQADDLIELLRKL